ncbi:adenosylcobinamide-GDP ribazoletransferase [Priestia aryabhattai]|uniref:adenosylcobinamide-GDP ribazoletransferase n=1 Tax=Bacillaceae TaxID=186817 RepID=UPI000BA002E8|nr:adenosylcobinamide-GDP ribazoletransferase [Bacillus sp. CBEL-1]OZT14194.1 adenosylcobinamide-GDP ribazoletransferase [Priestia aryabhattai]TDB54996.1 adenosylcobinamide-GDP ribazoletransferase [Bacillus sp. CBEL-1]
MAVKEWIVIARLALQFFTILPTAKTIQWTEKRTAKALYFLPWIGACIGAVSYSLFVGLESLGVSSVTIAVLLMVASAILTGGLHLDGWMDVSDAYFSHQPREKKLVILSDPNIGAFAVLSILALLALRFSGINELMNTHQSIDLAAFMSAFILPRIVAGWILLWGQPAKETGLASYFQKGSTERQKWIYATMSILMIAGLVYFMENKAVILIGAMAVFIWIKFYRAQFGGITGDVVGATIEGGETLVWVSMWICYLFGTV